MTIGIIGNAKKPSLSSSITALLGFGPKYGLTFFLHDQLLPIFAPNKTVIVPDDRYLSSADLVRKSDIVVAFGGDGTMLSAARMVGNAGIPILGINLGKLGFLAEASLEELESFMKDITANRHTVEERTVLSISLEGQPVELFALNEVVIDKSSSSRVIRLSVDVNDDYLVGFHGDGIIIATPTGSTGYALAAGAPIVVPTARDIVIQPVSAHSLSARTVIVPDSSAIRVSVEDNADDARLTVDGQIVRTIATMKKVTIRKADFLVRLIKRKDRSYYDVLRAKLLWGNDVRMGNSKLR